jgi:hypothetical protein
MFSFDFPLYVCSYDDIIYELNNSTYFRESEKHKEICETNNGR